MAAKGFERLGDAPIEPEFHNKMNALAAALDTLFNGDKHGIEREVGFIVITFKFGEDQGRTNYISNADRESVVTMLKHQIARFEGQPDIRGHA